MEYSMKVKVQIELDTKPQKSHLDKMYDAAEELTDDRKSIKINTIVKKKNLMIAEFTMKKVKQIDVVDKIGRRFAMFMENYQDTLISFPKK